MLESYKISQEQFYSAIFSAVVQHSKISHAYLIDTSGFSDAENLVLSFAKFLLCKNHYVNFSQCGDCKLCSYIDKQIDNHIQIISPDNIWIKKEQLIGLKEEFSKKSLDNLNQIYIIKQAECLNKAAANSLLKFLEEPEAGIIAILVTNNRYKLLPTILSRCQIYSLKGEKELEVDDSYSDLFDFLMNMERNGCQTICYIQDLWHSKYKTKEEVSDCFSKMEIIYIHLIHYNITKKTVFVDYIQDMDYIISHNSDVTLVQKLSKIMECKNQIPYNVNLSLLMDKFIIEYVGGVIHD